MNIIYNMKGYEHKKKYEYNLQYKNKINKNINKLYFIGFKSKLCAY